MISGSLFIKIDYLHLVYIGNISNLKFNYIEINEKKNFNFDDNYHEYMHNAESFDLTNLNLTKQNSNIVRKFTNHITTISDEDITNILSILI